MLSQGSVGWNVGVFVGDKEGSLVGLWVGGFVGLYVGDWVGKCVGLSVGDGVNCLIWCVFVSFLVYSRRYRKIGS